MKKKQNHKLTYKQSKKEDAESIAADKSFKEAVKQLEALSDKVELLPAIDARYDEKFVVSKEGFDQIEKDIEKVDFFLCMNWRIPKLERYGKTVVIMQNGNEGIDFAAYCHSLGLEAHVAMDMKDLNEIAHQLWVRKAVANTRALVLTAGSQPTFGIQSLIRNPEIIRQRYGMEIIKLPFRDIFKYIDEIDEDEAQSIADKVVNESKETKVNTDYFINDIKYYLAAKKMMEVYQCNAFSTTCHELCTSEIPQKRKFTP